MGLILLYVREEEKALSRSESIRLVVNSIQKSIIFMLNCEDSYMEAVSCLPIS